MKYLLKRLAIFSIIPAIIIILLLIGYALLDPLKVLYKYDTYSIDEINLNRDYISTETLLNNYTKEGYNSFILGSSHAMGYNPESWKTYLGDQANVFSYDAYSETLFGIYKKMMLLDSLQIPINNVLILIDTDKHFFLTNKGDGAYLYRKSPILLGNSFCERASFQLGHLGGYMHPQFFIPYYIHHFTGISNSLVQSKQSKRVMEIKYPENWLNSPNLEEQIKNNPDYFHSSWFYERTGNEEIQDVQISENQKKMFEGIKRILIKNNTDYKIIINPLYNQLKINDEDTITLNRIFGESHVYDFSGKNSLTEPRQNYYDRFHFRPGVGDSIMNIIYKNKRSGI